MKYYPLSNSTRNGLRFSVMLLSLLHCFSSKSEKVSVKSQEVLAVMKTYINYLVKLQVHRLELIFVLFHILKNILCPSPQNS